MNNFKNCKIYTKNINNYFSAILLKFNDALKVSIKNLSMNQNPEQQLYLQNACNVVGIINQ